VAIYVYIYYMESNNNYMFRPLLMVIFRLYMKTLLLAVIQSIYVGYLYGLGEGVKWVRDLQCGIQHHSRELLMMGIVVPETC